MNPPEGLLLVDKQEGRTSFSAVARVRAMTGQKTVGHAGTLDPFATGLLILLLGRAWTRRADEFMHQQKEYHTVLRLGAETDSYDCDGNITNTSSYEPSFDDVQHILERFQGEQLQIPPMFSAKKIQGKRLYEHARKGIVVERKPSVVHISTTFVEYAYPYLTLDVRCSKGTYIRSLGHDIGQALGCYAHLASLRRTKSGSLTVQNACILENTTKESIVNYIHQPNACVYE